MTSKHNTLGRYLIKLGLNPKEARATFAEQFGFPVDSSQVEAEIETFLDTLNNNLAATGSVRAPLHLLLAVALRPKGKGKGRKRPPKPLLAKRMQGSLIRFANQNWAQRVEAGEPSKIAKYIAAKEEFERNPTRNTGINSVEVLLSKMRLKDGQKYLNSNSAKRF